MSVEIKFCGAAGVVTGSCYHITTAKGSFIIDCGLFQGTKTVRELNYGGFGFEAKDLSFALLTHAHIDHSGLLPKLFKEGFEGKIYTSEPTKDLLEYMLPDSAHIQETEVFRLNKRNAQRGLPEVLPIYTYVEVEDCLESISFIKFDNWIDLPLGVQARFWNAGHILGAASIELKIPNEKGDPVHILFSGDLGPNNKMFHPEPESPHDIDYLVVESTYGGRTREDPTIESRREHLRKEILGAVEANGNIIIPAFAVERTQEILMDIEWLIEHSKIPALSIFIDSPLATKVTGVFEKYRSELEDMSGPCTSFGGPNIHYTQSVEESKSLNRIKSGAIIMSASGMCDAGRIRHHLKNNLWNPNSTILFVGYQAEGTLGRILQTAPETIRMFGEEIEVKARIRSIETYSAHADQDELLAWVKARLAIKKNVFITHGADKEREAMSLHLKEIGIKEKAIIIPSIDERFSLDTNVAVKLADGKPRLTNVEMAETMDWHNNYARFVLDLAQSLRGMKTADERYALLSNLTKEMQTLKKDPHKAVRKKA